jgi:hypothetical protein
MLTIINFAGAFFKSKVAPVHQSPRTSKILLARAREYRHSRTQKMAVVALDNFL